MRRALAPALLAVLLALVAPGALPLRAQEPPAPVDPAPVAPASVPDYVPLSDVKAIDAGESHACALTTAGRLYCWGRNDRGQLGTNSTVASRTPVTPVGMGSGVTTVATGSSHTCALISDGTVKCWGHNFSGQLGLGTSGGNVLMPTVVPGLTGVTGLAAGQGHTCARLSSASLKCWGFNFSGQVGDGTSGNYRLAPTAVVGLPAMASVVAGSSHTCAISASGPLWCWGENGSGQVGDGTLDDRSTPVQLFAHAIIMAVAAGSGHTCAIQDSGRTWCWGFNYNGQLGDGTTTSRPTGAYVYGMGVNGAADRIDSRSDHTCARLPSSALACWGLNNLGQLGPESELSAETHPVIVTGLPGSVAAIAAGHFFTCALLDAGQVHCWGTNSSGQLGDATILTRAAPAPVLVLATCYKLTRAKSGAAGSTPVAVPPQSDGCTQDHFVAGTPIQLVAAPALGNKVRAWQGVIGATPGVNVALYTMPTADAAINVLYGTCRKLTLQVSGGTGALRASPANALGCGSGYYGVSDRITLVASPAATQRVASWTGADTAPGTGMDVNTVTMPDADRTVNVVYEACLVLSVSVSGAGDAPIVYPAQSEGCAAASTFAAGETVTLVARPAPGYLVGGWSGTDGTDPFAAAQLTMPASGAQVSVTYAPASHTTYLPAVQR